MPTSTSPHPHEIKDVLSQLTSADEKTTLLAKEVALLAYAEERSKTAIIEGRAFGLMQFAKVGLTIIAGIAGLISNAGIHDTPFRESLILLLAVASAYLCKLFYRGSRVVRVGTIFTPHSDTHVKPDIEDVIATQSGSYLDALRTYVAKVMFYFEHTKENNEKRIFQCKCCYTNTFGFLTAFFLFFALSLMHLFEPNFTLMLPSHRIIGCVLFVFALFTDTLVEHSGNKWLSRK